MIGRNWAVAATLLAAVGATGPAGAQKDEGSQTETRLGSRIPWNIEEPTAAQAEAARILYRFARCEVRAHPVESAALLRTNPNRPEYRTILSTLVGGAGGNRCLSYSRMELGDFSFRGAIANALYERDYPTFPADRLAPSPEEAGAYLSGVGGNLLPEFAHCVARTNPAAVDAVLRTRWGSRTEREALRNLSSDFSSCLFQGQAVQANALTLRAILAEAAYRLSLGQGPRTAD